MIKGFFSFLCIVLLATTHAFAREAIAKAPSHLVILGDPHLPGKNVPLKEKVINTINQWNDVTMVVAMGDVCEHRGTSEEYAFVKTFFDKLTKPLFAIVGNHDYIYDDALNVDNKLQKANPKEQQKKLQRFKETFGLQTLSYSLVHEGYFLIFLSLDSSKHLTLLSSEQLLWLSNELEKNKKLPTIIFFHAPLDKTLNDYKDHVNKPDFIAQPVGEIRDILFKNHQVFLWISGHTHTSPKEESFASYINLYENQVTNIHNTDMNKETIWTNSLFLYQDKVIVKTYDHNTHNWRGEQERVILLPTISKF